MFIRIERASSIPISRQMAEQIRASCLSGSLKAGDRLRSVRELARLETRGIYCGIVKRRVRGQAELPRYQQLINRLIASVRAVVEHPFAWLKQMGHGWVRYRGRRRNAFDFALMAIAYNFKRSLSLTKPAT